ncbi:MAG: hypothetical protein L6Q51_11750 [Cyclobacteriaceae bacterium]|nr:hypothetical protein [Cyclobacteriaceae bacterium]
MLRRLLPDITSGLTVSFAAISLGAAFGVMSGRGAFAGMISAAIIPIITSLFGGTRLQASGPTAPMTAVSALTVAFAYDQFPVKELAEQFITLVFILNAGLLMVAGLARIGRFIALIPNVVILGFMNGIAVLIWFDQFKRAFAINKPVMAGGMGINLLLVIITFALIFGIIWLTKRVALRPILRSLISGVLFSILIMTVVSVVFNLQVEKVQLGATAATLHEFLNTLTNYFPAEILQPKYIFMALPFALELALLAYLDSLLTALVVDRLTKEKSNLNRELVAQGIANGAAGLLQGIPGAQATIRSVLLIKEGAQSRVAGVLIGVFALLSIIAFKDYLALVPAAVFMGVLLKAGLDVSDKEFIKSYISNRWYQSAQRNMQLGIIAYTTLVTVLIDLNVAVISGTLLFYIVKYFWKISDAEPTLEEPVAQHSKLVTG